MNKKDYQKQYRRLQSLQYKGYDCTIPGEKERTYWEGWKRILEDEEKEKRLRNEKG
ncbi:MAG TPA: hypothetical protein VGB37_14015 [Candidatus Lokiarchaeia archaeon]